MLWSVIMAGGSGTRFWPESRKQKPKQFLHLFGKKNLLEQTLERNRVLIPSKRTIIVVQKDHVASVRKMKGCRGAQVIGEPIGRNTAPCAVLAAVLALKKDPNAVVSLLPADHRIEKKSLYLKTLRSAHQVALKTGKPVTFGMKPTYAHTGYGYLEVAKVVSSEQGLKVHQLKRFCEKPNLVTAKKFFKSKRYLWNSGMFVWKAESLLAAAKRHQPKIYDVALKIGHGNLTHQMQRFFKKMPNISIDFGLMEKLKGSILTIPANFGWNDLGGWQVFPDLWSSDRSGNVVAGDAVLVKSRGNIIKTDKRLVATLGVDNLVIVDTKDALMVCHRDQTEQVREIVNQLDKQKRRKYL